MKYQRKIRQVTEISVCTIKDFHKLFASFNDFIQQVANAKHYYFEPNYTIVFTFKESSILVKLFFFTALLEQIKNHFNHQTI